MQKLIYSVLSLFFLGGSIAYASDKVKNLHKKPSPAISHTSSDRYANQEVSHLKSKQIKNQAAKPIANTNRPKATSKQRRNYIGETEKNLSNLKPKKSVKSPPNNNAKINKPSSNNRILLFDEADAFKGSDEELQTIRSTKKKLKKNK